MRIARLPHVAKRVAACALFAFGTLILQGCGDEPESAAAPAEGSAQPTTPTPDPYAELDAKFPNGRPKPSTVAERGQDSDYVKKLSALPAERVRLSQAVAAAQAEVDRFRAQYAKDATRRFGHAPTEEDLDASLANNAHYQKLVKAVTDAQAALDAYTVKVSQLINEKRFGEAKAYDALRREADAAAVAAGLPLRNDTPQQTAPAATAPQVQPAAAAKPAASVTPQALSEATGIPLVPSDR